ncbi:hypothetical protein [uncultured Aquitalea sp.]|uniref:hypothetical protein n=1 Tax=uncultured Aquitalea sp. TaxID=540272 RepID=UPI0025F649F9|nr:hypothetical protein [uncultured Aquitalea sp.]
MTRSDTAGRLVRYWRQRPHLHRDGISLPESLLFGQLKQALDSEAMEVAALSLLSRDSTLHLVLKQPLAARLTLHLDFLPPDWAQRQLRLAYHVDGEAASPSLLRRAIGGLVLTALSGGMGDRLLRQLAAPLDWLKLEDGIATIGLDALPAVKEWLDYPLFGRALGERWQVRTLETSPGWLRLRFAKT